MKKLLLITISIVLIAFSCTSPDVQIIKLDKWYFHTGDDLTWAKPGYNHENWDTIRPGIKWEDQQWKDYDGYAWYRVSFELPLSMKNNAYIKDSLEIKLGKIDDTDQTFLNGRLIGQNGELIPVSKADNIEKFERDSSAYAIFRNYVLPVEDERIKWDKKNVLAIRVHDHGGGGGLYGSMPEVSMKDFNDLVSINTLSSPFVFMGENQINKIINIRNSSKKYTIGGKLSIAVKNLSTGEIIHEKVQELNLTPGGDQNMAYELNIDRGERYKARYSFTEQNSKLHFHEEQEIPYILTPPASDHPSVNGPIVYGVRPGAPFLYKIPATGATPLTYSAEGLPYSLQLDETTGIVTGKIYRKKNYPVKWIAQNELGADTLDFTIKVGDQIALTPPMGWNSWNVWGLSVDEEKVKEAADYMVSTGLIDHGWTYINIDDGWEAPERTEQGILLGNEKFPDMKGLVDYVHQKGLKIGIYSSPGPETCGGYLGSYQHEFQDAFTWSRWGFDYLKYDWCSYSQIAKDRGLEELQKPYIMMNKALQRINRDIVYSLCQYGWGDVWEWGADVGGNLWRTTGDIVDTWESMSHIGFNQVNMARYAGPGHWNDPDMLVVGWVGWGPNLHLTRLSSNEQYTHISLWCLLSAPLLLGCDLSRLDDFTLNLLTNDEVLAVNQDPLGNQATPIIKKGNIQVWAKTMVDSSLAVGIFNLGDKGTDYNLELEKLDLEGEQTIRNLWKQENLGTFAGTFKTRVPMHGVKLLKIKTK